MGFYFASGDAPFFFEEQLRTLSFIPSAWLSSHGFGQSIIPRFWLDLPFSIVTYFLFQLGLNWFWIDKLVWGGMVALAWFAAFSCARFIVTGKFYRLVFAFFYCINTYTLMLFDGGQLGVLYAYAIFPFITVSALKYAQESNVKRAIALSGTLAVLLLFDLRIWLLSLPLCVAVIVFGFLKKRKVPATVLIVPLLLCLFHSYWLLPMILFPGATASYSQHSAVEQVNFFSFADFTHAFSLLHPNWPDNIFGKVSFFKPEYLFIPLIGFLVLLQKKIGLVVTCGIFLVIGGSFLSKGTQQPFGEIYEMLFIHLPGFSLFRDPTKWYLYTALGYALLLTLFLRTQKKMYAVIVVALSVLLYLPAFQASRGNLRPSALESEQVRLKDFIRAMPSQRTLWLPTREQYSYQDSNHPSLTAYDMFSESSVSGILRALENPVYRELISESGVGLIIVPPDYRKKIFLEDYLFSPALRETLVTGLRNQGFELEPAFQEFAVFYTYAKKPLIEHTNREVIYRFSYDPNWRLYTGKEYIAPQKISNNSMKFTGVTDTEFSLIYRPQNVVLWGMTISFISIMGSLLTYVTLRRT